MGRHTCELCLPGLHDEAEAGGDACCCKATVESAMRTSSGSDTERQWRFAAGSPVGGTICASLLVGGACDLTLWCSRQLWPFMLGNISVTSGCLNGEHFCVSAAALLYDDDSAVVVTSSNGEELESFCLSRMSPLRLLLRC